ncbi:MAG: DUF1425 domain-containing protein [Limisphaerales bacterium]
MFYYPPRHEFWKLFGKKCAALLCLAWLAATGCSSPGNQNEPPSLATPLSARPPDQPSAAPPLPEPVVLSPPQQPAARPPRQPTAQAPAKDNRTLFASSISQALHAAKVQYTTGSEGYLKIQVDVENRSDASVPFRYAIEWLNANGDVLPFANNGFLDWTLRARETSTIAATAPTPAAKDFRVVFVGPSKK